MSSLACMVWGTKVFHRQQNSHGKTHGQFQFGVPDGSAAKPCLHNFTAHENQNPDL